MSAREKEKSVDFAKKKELSAKLGIATNEMCTQPRFASHTQSSLMKKRTPINLKKSARKIKESKKSQGSLSRLSGICKRRNNVKSRSLQAVATILKQKKNRRVSIFTQDSEVKGIFCQSEQCAENSLVFLQNDVIKDFRDLKRYTGSPVKLVRDELPEQLKIIDQSENTENSHVSLQDEMRCIENSFAFLQNSLENTCDISKDRTIVDIACKPQSQSSDDEEESADSQCEVEVHHRSRQRESKRKLEEDFSKKECSENEIQMFQQIMSANANSATNHKYHHKVRKTWNKVKAVDRVDLQGSRISKFIKIIDDSQDKDIGSVVNDDISVQKKSALKKSLVFINQTWEPPGTKTSITKTTTSLTQPSQKSSRSIKRSITSTRSKHSSIEHVKSFDNESTSASISANHSKMLMKENKDPHTNRVTKICEYLAEVKQQRLQNVGTLPKRRRSMTKVTSNASNKYDDTIRSKPTSRRWYMQSIMPKRSSKNDVEQYHIESTLIHDKRSKVIHALKEIIDSVRKDEDMEDNASKNYTSNHEKSDIDLQILSNRDVSLKTSQNEINFTKNKNLNETSRSFDPSSYKSISTQTELNPSSYLKTNSEKDDSKEISKSTVATQTSLSNKSTVEIECNTTPYDVIHKDVEVFCDLIDFSANSEAEVNLTIEDKLTIDPIHTTGFSSIKYTEINDEYTNDSKKLPLSEYNKTLNTKLNLKLENCNKEILAKTTNDFIMEAEKITHEKTYLSLRSSKSSDDKMNTDIDKHKKFTKCFNNHDVNNDSTDNLFLKKSCQPSLSIHDYDAFCSSEEITEYLENGVQYKDMIESEFKLKNIPSDVIATFELAAERARNLHRAVIIYYENLILKEFEKQNKEIENYEILKARKDQHCLEECASSISCESKNRIKSERNEKSHFVVTNDEALDDSSMCSSCSSSYFDQMSETEFPKLSKINYSEIDREEKNAIVPRNKRAITKSVLTEHSNLADMKSLMELLVHHMQEEYALELLKKKDGNDESFEMREATKTIPMTIKKNSIISCENLLLICCVLCTILYVLWGLQFSFRCDSAV